MWQWVIVGYGLFVGAVTVLVRAVERSRRLERQREHRLLIRERYGEPPDFVPSDWGR